MFVQLEHLGKYAFVIFDNTRHKPYSSPASPEILVSESPVYQLDRRSHPEVGLSGIF